MIRILFVFVVFMLSLYGEPKQPIKPQFKNDSAKIQIYDFRIAHPHGFVGRNATYKEFTKPPLK